MGACGACYQPKVIGPGGTLARLRSSRSRGARLHWRNFMNVLIVYGTTEGQTRKIAEWTATHARKLGHKVELRDSTSPVYDSDLQSFDAFVIAASVHQERHQDAII